MRAQWEAWQQREGRAQAVALPPHARASRFFSPLNRSTKPNVRHRCNAPPARMRPGPAPAWLSWRYARYAGCGEQWPRLVGRYGGIAATAPPTRALAIADDSALPAPCCGSAPTPSSALAPNALAPNALAPKALAPYALAPITLAPNALAPYALAPYAMAPYALTPNALAPNALAPNALAPNALAPYALAPYALAPNTLAPYALAPYAMAPYALVPNALAPNALPPNALAP
ncbi:unnamed protein product [Closterium sp. NIES-64]|nr:unnamed protein product [Closterium sp. NIES-64]